MGEVEHSYAIAWIWWAILTYTIIGRFIFNNGNWSYYYDFYERLRMSDIKVGYYIIWDIRHTSWYWSDALLDQYHFLI